MMPFFPERFFNVPHKCGAEKEPMPFFDPSLYVVTGPTFPGMSVDQVVSAAVLGGATMIQFREKELAPYELVPLGTRLLAITRAAGIPLVVNDHLELAREIGADGLHLGQEDIRGKNLAEIRRKMAGKILGISASTPNEAILAQEAQADYIGAGPVFPTSTKADAVPPIGMAGLKKIINAVNIPVVAIGGINVHNAVGVVSCGSVGIAVISAVMGAENPALAASKLLGIIKSVK